MTFLDARRQKNFVRSLVYRRLSVYVVLINTHQYVNFINSFFSTSLRKKQTPSKFQVSTTSSLGCVYFSVSLNFYSYISYILTLTCYGSTQQLDNNNSLRLFKFWRYISKYIYRFKTAPCVPHQSTSQENRSEVIRKVEVPHWMITPGLFVSWVRLDESN